MSDDLSSSRSPAARTAEVFAAFLKLGLVSFGGPAAHLGYFNAEFVVRRKWLSAAAYAEIVALCQFLPGPASSQAGMALGLARAGLPGAAAAWFGFTLPSALLMAAFAYAVGTAADLSAAPWLHGLKIAAVAVVAQAVVTMARALCPDLRRASIAAAGAGVAILIPSAAGQIGAIALGGLLGWLWLKTAASDDLPDPPLTVPRGVAVAALGVFFLLLVLLPLAKAGGGLSAALFDSFYRAGALVFGGGHVVLPLLERAVVPPGWIDPHTFLAGYGAAQAVPGPLFTFAAFLGAHIGGAEFALLCLVAIFLPSFLLVVGVAPFWRAVRGHAPVRAALTGVNAAVVGLLAAAFYDPIATRAITGLWDIGLACALFALLMAARAPSWLVVLLGAGASSAVALI